MSFLPSLGLHSHRYWLRLFFFISILIILFVILFWPRPKLNFLLTNVACALEEAYFERLSLRITEDQPFLYGINSKFLLYDNQNRPWLFKVEHDGLDKIVLAVYRFGKYCGVPLPEIHAFTVIVNGKKNTGTIERFVEDCKTSDNISMIEISPVQLNILAAHQVFDNFIWNFENSPSNFLINRKTGELFFIDKNRAFGFESQNMSLSDNYRYGTRDFLNSLYNRMWDALHKGTITIDVSESMSLLRYMSESDWRDIKKLFAPLERLDNNILFGNMELLKEKQKRLYTDFLEFYRIQQKKSKGRLIGIDSHSHYEFSVYRKLAGQLFQLLRDIHLLLRKPQPQVCSFTIIASSEAWDMIREDFVPQAQSQYDLMRLTQRLMTLLETTLDPNEKLVIRLYLERCDLLKKQGQTRTFNDMHMLWRLSQRPQHIDPKYFTSLYSFTRETQKRIKALTSYSIGRQIFLLLQTPEKIAQTLAVLPKDQRTYGLAGILDAAMEEKMSGQFFEILFEKVEDIFKPLVVFLIGEHINTFEQLRIISQSERYRKYAICLYYGFGVRLGKQFWKNPDVLHSMLVQPDKSYICVLYPGFGMGWAAENKNNYRLLAETLRGLPGFLRFYCLEAIGRRLLYDADFDSGGIQNTLSSTLFTTIEKRLICRGLGEGIAYWFFGEIENAKKLVSSLSKENRLDISMGSRFFLTRHLLPTPIEFHPENWNRFLLLERMLFEEF